MTTPHPVWKVHPHSAFQQLDDNLWRVEGSLPSGPVKRVMTVAKRSDGQLVIHNAIAMEESAMKELDAQGPIGFLIVPNAYHRLDAPAFKHRYPNARVVCPSGSRKGVEAKVPVDLTYADYPNDPKVELHMLPGVKDQEGYMLVKSTGGTTLVLNDAVFNMPHAPGVIGFVLKSITKSSGGPVVSNVFRWLSLKDKAAFRASLEAIARTPNLKRVIVSHHEVIDTDPAGVLTRVASTL